MFCYACRTTADLFTDLLRNNPLEDSSDVTLFFTLLRSALQEENPDEAQVGDSAPASAPQ